MPEYNYKCNNCGFQHSQIHRVAATPEPCPKCRDPRHLEKLPQEVKVQQPPPERKKGEIVHQTIEEEERMLEEERQRRRKMWDPQNNS